MTDSYNKGDSYPDPQEQNESVRDDDSTAISYKDLYDRGIQVFFQRGFQLKPAIEGTYAYHHVRTLESPQTFKGYNPPRDFKFYKNALGSLDTEELVSVVTDLKNLDPALFKFWSPLINPSGTKRQPLYSYAKFLISQEAQTSLYDPSPFNDGISLCGTSGATCFIPQKEWFSEKLQGVRSKDLITILPESERHMLMLTIGRALVGRDNSYTTEGTLIKHTFRAFCLMVGSEAGMGKSTIMNRVLSAFHLCGYNSEVIYDISSRFGWGVVANSHLGYLDDLTKASQKKFITHNLTKQLVSNGLITTELKGVDPVTTKSRTTVIACSNDYNPRDFHDMDSGLISRSHFLSTYKQPELEPIDTEYSEGSPDTRPRYHWDYVAKKAETDLEGLTLWFLHLCAEYFLDVVGYHHDGKMYQQSEEDLLEHTVKDLAKDYVIKSFSNATQNLMMTVRFLVLLYFPNSNRGKEDFIFSAKRLFQAIECFYTVGNEFNYNSIRDLLQADYILRGKPDWHPHLGVTGINMTSIPAALFNTEQKVRSQSTEHEIFTTLMSSIMGVSGFRLIGDPVWILRLWNEACLYDRYLEEIIPGYRQVELNRRLIPSHLAGKLSSGFPE